MSKIEIPSIRFRGFDDAWEQRKLGDCFSERVENMPDGELISVTINDGIKKFSELGRHDNSNDDKSKYKKVCVGDIAYNSMRMWQGASGYSPYEGIVSPAYTVLSPNAGVLSKCIAYQFKLPQMIHTFQINSQGITSDNWNLKYPALSEIEIYISQSAAEQKQIAEFFTSIDRLITLHQRKFEKLTNVKKSMLEKMFPQNGSSYPEIRFKGFSDAWEWRKLGELISEYKETVDSSCTLPVLTSSKTEGVILQEEHFGRKQQHDITGYNVLPRSYCTYRNRSDGVDFTFNVNDCCDRGIISKFYPVFCGNVNDTYFLSLVLNNSDEVVHEIAYTCTGTGQKVLSFLDLQKMSIRAPRHDEQKKISAYFKQLDHLITLHRRELEKLQSIKKSLLEKMLV